MKWSIFDPTLVKPKGANLFSNVAKIGNYIVCISFILAFPTFDQMKNV